MSRPSKKLAEVGGKLSLLRLLFDPENGGDIFLRNVLFSKLHGVTTLKTILLVEGLAAGWTTKGSEFESR
jgi:hypothetical protein